MNDLAQELMTPHEAARWFRRSRTWLRQRRDLLRVGASGGQPLFHVRVCRAYVLGRLCNLRDENLHRIQIDSLASACGLDRAHQLLSAGNAAAADGDSGSSPTEAATRAE